MFKSKIFLLILSFIMFPNLVLSSQKYPTTGMVYNTKDNNMIVYDCKLLKNQELECDMTSTSVRKSHKELSEEIKEAQKQWKNQKPFSKKDCKMYEQIISLFEGKTPPPNKKGDEMIKNMKSFEKNDFIKLSKSALEYCKTPDKSNFLKMITTGHDKKSRTCKVSSNSFKQKFEKVDLISDTWRVVPEATGPCGIIQLDRLELVNKKYSFWNYISKKAITNPDGQAGLLKCNQLDENEYVYSWKKREIALNCDYIDFGF